jgi:hypothetical protein
LFRVIDQVYGYNNKKGKKCEGNERPPNFNPLDFEFFDT